MTVHRIAGKKLKYPDEMPIDEFFAKSELSHELVHVYHACRIDGHINTVGDLRKTIREDGFCRLQLMGPKTTKWLLHHLSQES